MEDKNVISHIDKLAREEHELFERGLHGKATDADGERLRQLQGMLDQCWDLLRQRRAKREFGFDPNEAEPRDQRVIKGYSG